MKSRDIEIGKQYQVRFSFGTVVTCRVISKSFFGLRILEEHGERWDVGYPSYKVYGHHWAWRFVEPF